MKALLLSLLGAPALVLAQTEPPVPTFDSSKLAPATDGAKEMPKVNITADQAASILKQLDGAEKTNGTTRSAAMGLALQRCKAASASEKDALDLYIACYKTDHFDKLNLKPTDFLEWKQHNEDRFKDPGFLGSLVLQVRYLTLTIQAQDAKDKDMPSLIAGLQSVISDMIKVTQNSVVHTTSGAVKENDKNKKPPTRGGGPATRTFDSTTLMKHLEQSVKESEFAKAFQLEEYLVREDWEYAPVEIGNIYDLTIFPYYLLAKPAELAAQWDLRITSQLAFKQALFTDVEYQEYYTKKYPELLWSKYKFLLMSNVDPTKALAEMLKVIRTYSTHPKAGDWIKEMRELVTKSQEPTTSANAVTPPPAN